jgi:hypothetical protein
VPDVIDADEVIRSYARDFGAMIRSESRTSMTSPLFDLPGRSSLAFAFVYDVAPEFVDVLERHMPAEDLGARMRAPLMRPYFLQPSLVIEGMLMGRDQRILDGAESGDGDDERTARVVTWAARACGSARTDGRWWPGEPELTMPLLDEGAVVAFGGDAEPFPRETADRVHRAIGALEVYALTVHGEQRDGNFHHGPYTRADGSKVVFHELNDLSNTVLPWMDETVTLGVDAVGVVDALDAGVDTSFDLFGSMTSSPVEPRREARAAWIRAGGELRPASVGELEALAAAARQATAELYRRIVAWDQPYRTAYGADLWINHLLPLAELAGAAAEARPLLEERAAAVTRAELPRLVGSPPRSVWTHVANGPATRFTPLTTQTTR